MRFSRWFFRAMSMATLLVGSLGTSDARAATIPQPPDSGCFWSTEVNTTTHNLAFPNGLLTDYWYSKFTLPAGARIVFHGKFPDSRYMSFNSYYTSPTFGPGIATDALYDQQIAADPGSENPFLPGAKRTPDKWHRFWTVTVSGEQPPAPGDPREPNVLYAGTLSADQGQPVELLYRIYVADKNFDIAGGGDLPQPTLVLGNGTELSGQAACDAVHVDTTIPSPNTMPLAQYLALTHLPPNGNLGAPGSGPQAPAVNPPQWYRSYNPCHFGDPFFQAAGYPVQSCPNTLALTQWPTKDNAYIGAYVDRSFGPAADGHNVLVVTGKMPTTPTTYQRDPFFTGGTQMRYWGICSNESLFTTAATVFDGCAYDEEIPTDDDGNYVIVVSMPEDRPLNATDRCGVKWIHWGAGDGAPPPYTRSTAGLIIVRNLLPDPSFTQAAQNVPAPGLPADVAATMGPYVPTLSYMSSAEFETLGCLTH